MPSWNNRDSITEEVVLNVYDLSSETNHYLYPAGFGFYHSGVQVGNKEYTFANGGGIFSHEPGEAPGAKFRCSVFMGKISRARGAVDDAILSLREEFGPNSYNLLSKNCNTFSDALCRVLLNKPIPGWVNRIAYLSSWFSCLIPPQILGDAPVNTPTAHNTEAVNSGREAEASSSRHVAYAGQGVSLGTSNEVINSDLIDRREKIRQARIAALHQ